MGRWSADPFVERLVAHLVAEGWVAAEGPGLTRGRTTILFDTSHALEVYGHDSRRLAELDVGRANLIKRFDLAQDAPEVEVSMAVAQWLDSITR